MYQLGSLLLVDPPGLQDHQASADPQDFLVVVDPPVSVADRGTVVSRSIRTPEGVVQDFIQTPKKHRKEQDAWMQVLYRHKSTAHFRSDRPVTRQEKRTCSIRAPGLSKSAKQSLDACCFYLARRCMGVEFELPQLFDTYLSNYTMNSTCEISTFLHASCCSSVTFSQSPRILRASKHDSKYPDLDFAVREIRWTVRVFAS